MCALVMSPNLSYYVFITTIIILVVNLYRTWFLDGKTYLVINKSANVLKGLMSCSTVHCVYSQGWTISDITCLRILLNSLDTYVIQRITKNLSYIVLCYSCSSCGLLYQHEESSSDNDSFELCKMYQFVSLIQNSYTFSVIMEVKQKQHNIKRYVIICTRYT